MDRLNGYQIPIVREIVSYYLLFIIALLPISILIYPLY